jgi:hypothetical protein
VHRTLSHYAFRSTAEMIADGTVCRPAYLDLDSPFAESNGATGASRPLTAVPQIVAKTAPAVPVAVTIREEAVPRRNQRTRHPDRVGRLMH